MTDISQFPIPTLTVDPTDIQNAATNAALAITARDGAETARAGAETAKARAEAARAGAETAKARAEAARDAAQSAVLATYQVADDTALAALTGISSGNTAFVTGTGHFYHYDGSAWIDDGEGFLADLRAASTTAMIKVARSAALSALLTTAAPLYDQLTKNGITPGYALPAGLARLKFSTAGLPPILDYIADGSLRYVDGVAWVDQALFLAASGGAETTGGLEFGPWVDDTLSSALENADFAADVSGWTASSSATLSWQDGMAVLTASAANLPYISQKLTPDTGELAGNCFAFRGTGYCTDTKFRVMGTIQNASFGTGISATTTFGKSLTVTNFGFLNVGRGTNAYVGGGMNSATSSGRAYIDSFEVYRAAPLSNWPEDAGIDAYVEFTINAIPTTDQVVMQADAATERDRIRLVVQNDGHLWLVVTSNNVAQARLDLGAVLIGQTNIVAIGSGLNFVAGCLNGGDLLTDLIADPVGTSVLRVGHGLTSGQVLDGAVARLTVLPTSKDANFIKSLAGGTERAGIWAEGDSMMAGAYGYVLWEDIQDTTGVSTVNTATGGASWDTIVNRILASASYLKDYTLVIFDGSANGFVSVQDTLDRLAEVVAWKGDENWVYMPPLVGKRSNSSTIEGESTYTQNMKALLTGAVSRFGEHHVYTTIWSDLQALADGSTADANDVASGVLPGSIYATGDSTHLGDAANQAIAAGVAPVIANIRALTE